MKRSDALHRQLLEFKGDDETKIVCQVQSVLKKHQYLVVSRHGNAWVTEDIDKKMPICEHIHELKTFVKHYVRKETLCSRCIGERIIESELEFLFLDLDIPVEKDWRRARALLLEYQKEYPDDAGDFVSSFLRLFNFDAQIDKSPYDHRILFCVVIYKKKMVAFYKGAIMDDEFVTDGYYYIHPTYRGSGLCTLLSKHVLSHILRDMAFDWVEIYNIASWNGFFCYVGGADANGYEVYDWEDGGWSEKHSIKLEMLTNVKELLSLINKHVREGAFSLLKEDIEQLKTLHFYRNDKFFDEWRKEIEHILSILKEYPKEIVQRDLLFEINKRAPNSFHIAKPQETNKRTKIQQKKIGDRIEESQLEFLIIDSQKYVKEDYARALKLLREFRQQYPDEQDVRMPFYIQVLEKRGVDLEEPRDNYINDHVILHIVIYKEKLIATHHGVITEKDGVRYDDSNYFYIIPEFRSSGLCSILAKNVFRHALNDLNLGYIQLHNVVGWSGFFCYCSGADANGFDVYETMHDPNEDDKIHLDKLSSFKEALKEMKKHIQQEKFESLPQDIEVMENLKVLDDYTFSKWNRYNKNDLEELPRSSPEKVKAELLKTLEQMFPEYLRIQKPKKTNKRTKIQQKKIGDRIEEDQLEFIIIDLQKYVESDYERALTLIKAFIKKTPDERGQVLEHERLLLEKGRFEAPITLFLVVYKGELIATYNGTVDRTLKSVSRGYFYVLPRYRGSGVCRILAKKVFSHFILEQGLWGVYIHNIAGWRGFFCYVGGVIDAKDLAVQYNFFDVNLNKMMEFKEALETLRSHIQDHRFGDLVADIQALRKINFLDSKSFYMEWIQEVNDLLKKASSMPADDLENRFLSLLREKAPVEFAVAKPRNMEDYL
jgi:hypothetical protein